MAESLFPMVLIAVENNLPDLAVEHLQNAQAWIQEMTDDVDKIVEKYEQHIRHVASSTSDVIKEKQDTDAKILAQSQELREITDILNSLKNELEKTTAGLLQTEQKIKRKTQEIDEFIESINQTSMGLAIFAMVVPVIGLPVHLIYHAVNDSNQAAQLEALQAHLNALVADKTTENQKHWQQILKIAEYQMKSAKASFELNSIPDPIYLEEVQSSLTKIQGILNELKNFWEKISQLLADLRQKTFVGQSLIKHPELKYKFIKSIKAAEKAWSSFCESCERASVIFSLQAKDSYKFLEVSPSSLSKEQWQEEYEKVKEQLENIDLPLSLPSSEIPAITE